jgi:intracellular sulfur oxidation DsrE/DsrF family protein
MFGEQRGSGRSPAAFDSNSVRNHAQEEIHVQEIVSGPFVVGFFVACGATFSGDRADAQDDQALHIDVPVKLEKANVVFDIGHLVLNGDMPFFLGDMDLLASDLKDWNVKGEIIAVFHGDAAYVVLNDESYDANRRIQGHPVKTGNPYGKLIIELMRQGVQIELCGATAAANHWGNKDLLAGVEVNTNAMVRVTELEQKGFTLIYE